MPWWVWVVLGLILLGAEMLSPGTFFLLFFGVGALVVGSFEVLGLELPAWLQGLLFTVISVALLLVVRPRLVGMMRTSSASVEDTLVGEWATVGGEIPAGGLGRGELRGSVWSLQNAGESALAAGDRCRVERVVGLTLHVRK